jgi:hypothetical protein
MMRTAIISGIIRCFINILFLILFLLRFTASAVAGAEIFNIRDRIIRTESRQEYPGDIEVFILTRIKHINV